MKTALRFLILSVIVIAALTLGGICVVAFYDNLMDKVDPDLFENGFKTGLAAWMILLVGKLFTVSGKKKVQTKTI